MRIQYRVDALDRVGHRGRVTLDLEGVEQPTLDLVLPSWVPGSYKLVNYVRGIRDLAARGAEDGPAVGVQRVGADRWRLATAGIPRVRVQYTVYGHQMVNEAFDLTSDHMFLNAALALVYVDGHLDEPVTVELHLPPEWRVVTELEEVLTHPPTYRARNYDELVDSPIDAGRPLVLTIRPLGIPHRISICGDGGNYEAHRLEEDLGKIVEAATRLVGESPLKGYTFFIHLSDIPDGALEHASSNSSVFVRTVFEPLERYQRFLSTQSHEYFHLWNVKRIRPKVLGPFDYTQENYTGQLWWMEGTTDYFSDLVLRRAGLYTPAKYLEEAAKIARAVLLTPGRNSLSLEELSRIAWVDLYQPFEETPNQSVSYYAKGYLVSLCLDLEIRHRTETKASLESVIRLLWNEYGKTGRGLDEDELQPVAERATGLDLAEWFDRYVRGTAEVDVDRFAGFAGLTFGPKPKPADDDAPEPGYLGIRFEDGGGSVRINQVLLDTPGHRAGLSPGDEIVAINSTRVSHAKFEKELESYPPGTSVDLAVFRRGYLRHVAVTTGKAPPQKYRFAPLERATDVARKVHESWLGIPWEPSKPAGEARKDPAPPPPST
ncbi:MAG: PDZ domain-containing protein [Thermoplasmata archaeon]|nr:PDZ domain-containing protein [Thermoplasmata archaeon]